MHVVFKKDQLMILPMNLNGIHVSDRGIDTTPRTLKIDPTQRPKRLTLTDPVRNGKIAVQEGIYLLDGDRLILSLGNDGRIPHDFEKPTGATGVKFELQRVMP